jgi:hypothetical protein
MWFKNIIRMLVVLKVTLEVRKHVFDVAFPASSTVYAACEFEFDVFEFHFFYDDFSYGFCLFPS